MTMSRRAWALSIVAVLGVAAVAGGILWWLGGDEPEAVDAGRALDQDRGGLLLPLEDPVVEETTEEPPTEVLEGRWEVDTSRPFDRAEGRGTFVGYRIDEELTTVGEQTTVGRSPEVEGHVVFEGTRVVEARILAMLDALKSDDARRDNRVLSMLGLDATAEFVLDEPIELGEVPAIGEVVELTTSGTLRIRDVEDSVDVELQAAVTDSGLVITGSTVIVLDDFGLEVPSVPIVVRASDEATLEWQLFLRRP